MRSGTSLLAGVVLAVLGCSPASPRIAPPVTTSEAHAPVSTADTRLCTSFAEGARPAGEGPFVVRVLARDAIPPEAEKRGSVCDVLRTRAGAHLDASVVEGDMRELWRTGLFDDLRVTREPAGDGTVVTFELTPREEITLVSLEFSPPAPPNQAAAHLELDPLLPDPGLHDPSSDFASTNSVLGTLREMGFRRASATTRLVRDPATGTTLVFTVAAGTPTTVDAVKVTGLAILDQKKFSSELVTKVGEPVSDMAVERDGYMIAAAGYDEGLLQIHVGDPTIVESADGTHVTVTFPVEEGPQFKIGTIRFVGDLHGTSDEYVKRARAPKKGEVFRRRDLMAAFANITAFHASSGETVTVNPEVSLDAKTRVVDVTAHVTLMRP